MQLPEQATGKAGGLVRQISAASTASSLVAGRAPGVASAPQLGPATPATSSAEPGPGPGPTRRARRAATEKTLRGSGGLCRAFRCMPRVLAFAFWQQFYAYFAGDPFSAFVNTMVSCPLPEPSGQSCPSGAVYAEGRCEPQPPSDRDWSLSMHCADKGLVLQRTASLNGVNGWVGSIGGLLSVLVAGQYMDSRGRKPVLMLFMLFNLLVQALLCASCRMPWKPFLVVLFLQNAVEVAVGAGVGPALNAMVADLSRGNAALRGDAFAAMGVMTHVADVLAFIAGFPVLKLHLTDYMYFWGTLAIISCFAYCIFDRVIRETLLPDSSAEKAAASLPSAGPLQCCSELFRDSLVGFRLVWGDLFLRQVLIIWAFVTVAVTSSQSLAQSFLMSIGYEQADASMARAAWHVALVLGACLASPLIRHCGAFPTFGGSLAFMSVGWALLGLSGPLPEHGELLFWVCFTGVGGTAFGVLSPAFNAIASVRVESDEQGKLFAFSIVVNTLVGLALSLVWSQYLFAPKATGWRKGLIWLASAAVFTIMLLWFDVACRAEGGRSLRKEESSEGESLEDNSDSSPDESDESNGSA